MKIYISLDLEGINGVSKFSEIENKESQAYQKSIEQVFKEVNSVIRGAFKAGAETITVNDAHSSMTNIDLSKLDPRAILITGKPKTISMMAGLDTSYHAVIMMGYHAKASTSGACLAHTFLEPLINVEINGQSVGEAYLNSLYASTLNIPVAMATGDEALTEEVYTQIGVVPTVITKYALGMNAVQCKPNNILLKELEDTTEKSLNNPTNWIINKEEGPYELKVELSQIVMADLVELMPGVNRTNSRTISFTHPDFKTVYQLLQAICIMASTAKNYY